MTAREAAALVPPAVDTLPINVAILDAAGTILYTNDAWQEFGEANDIDHRPETIGTNYLEVTKRADSDTARTVAAGLTEILEGKRAQFEFEYPCHSPDENRWFLMRAASFTHDKSTYVAIIHSDITDRRESERELAESNERLEQFAYAASHDLQEPLRMVTSYLQLLERRYEDVLDDTGEEFLEFAIDGAERMKSMIDGLLEYSRVETRGDPLEPIDLDAIVENVRQDLELQIDETDAEITVETLPTVEGDGSQLRRVFQNLLSNALVYSGDEPPRISVSAERNGDEWIISVSDEGIGIDPDDQDRVFEVFQRLHSREEYEGTGIGLTLCKRIVNRHGGEIWVDSELGEGATVSFTLTDASSLE